jgi:small-conductance mechanosensitive channel/TolA-binding protein
LARSKWKASSARRGLIVFLFPVLVLLSAGWAQQTQPPQVDSDAILNHLNAAISWYRHVATLDATAGQPSDALYLQNARSSASQALQLAFQSALAEAALAAKAKGNGGNQGAGSNDQGGSDQQQGIAKDVAQAADRVTQAQSQIENLNQQIEDARGKKREELTSQRDALQGQLDLDKMIQDALQRVANVNNNENGGSALAKQINQLKQTVPEVFAPASFKNDGSSSNGQGSKSSSAESSGLFGKTSILFGQMSDMHDIDQLMSETMHLRSTADKLDMPLRESLKSLIRQGRDFVNQPPTADPAQIAERRKRFEALTTQFKEVSAAAVPLRQEMVLLDECHGELLEWRNSIGTEYGRVLRSLLTRVGLIFIALLCVFFLSEIWRRATYRYIHETRRRRQLMLIRRVVTGFLMAVVIAMGFISEFSSLATFAGFLTAGIAVALQTVILSVAAYFFLIGRYGVRVGDRITVGGVTGDVIDVGLVRLYLMELSGTGIDLYPTGRVVVFSNSVMFQAAPFFKQLPGTAYAWHEVAIALAPDTNHALAEQKLLEVVNSVYSKYQHDIDRQHALVERLIDAPVAAATPKAQLQFTDTGLEFVVRYPVEIPRAAEIDDEMTRKLTEVIAGEPELKAAVSGSPKLRAPIKA